jgi:hypothetical protein
VRDANSRLFLSALILGFFVSTVTAQPNSANARVGRGLRVFYTFEAKSGDVIRDRSGVGEPLNLKISDVAAVRWQQGGLVVQRPTKIQSQGAATKVTGAIKRSNSLTLEAWVRPSNLKQSGPARLASISANTSLRNLTLGQDGAKFEVRLRTTKTSTNGIPSTSGPNGSAKTALTHVVFTYDGTNAKLFINGKPQATNKIQGGLSNWDANYPLVVANESSDERPWLGSLHLLAIYVRALSAGEVSQNYSAGASGELAAMVAQNVQAKFFESKVAPLIAANCLDCHDSVTRKGALDLSKKELALAGGENGKVIVPGKSAESALFELVNSGDMPPDGNALSDDAKTVFRQWIDSGATWSLAEIDPVLYLHSEKTTSRFVRRLTVTEYIATVRAATGVDISKEAREILPPDLRADGFSNTAYNLNVDLKHVESYARLAEIIAARMDVLKFSQRYSKSRSLNTDATMRKFVEAMGSWLLRGPLEDREITNYCGIGTTVSSAGGDYQDGVRLIIESMLQSPRFIYRIENQRGDGTAWPVSPHELASRISYIVWGAPPDERLLKAADDGALLEPSQIRAEVRRMFQDPRAEERSSQFINEWLHLDRLGNMSPNTERFPQWEPQLGIDMREETLAYFRQVVWNENRPLTDLFNAQFTYATPRLAKHYGLKPADEGLVRYDLSSVPSRGGLLTQGSVLTVGGDDASMVTRGLFLLHDILRGTVKDPPAGLDTTPVPSKPGLPQRLIAEKRIGNMACGGCHSRFEPLAFGLEKYDGIGVFHHKDEHGNGLREDGEVLFPGAPDSVKYKSSKELMDLLATSDRVKESMTWKVAQFSLGRPLGSAEARSVKKIHQAAWKAGGTYASLIEAIVVSDLVMLSQTEPE